jgi:hypothetical protein
MDSVTPAEIDEQETEEPLEQAEHEQKTA